jgi:hypothetical protein
MVGIFIFIKPHLHAALPFITLSYQWHEFLTLFAKGTYEVVGIIKQLMANSMWERS